jgi:peptidylamidoglycolate lyase
MPGRGARRLPALTALILAGATAWALPQAAAEPRADTRAEPLWAPRPVYCLVADWPNLPGDIELGQAAGLGIDSRDLVYVFHRGERSWVTAPSLMARGRALWGALWASLFAEDPARETIAQDAILALDPATGELRASFGAGRFRIPHGLALDGDDNLGVTDVGLHQVFKFSRDGALLLSLGEAGRAGDDRTHFDGPTDVAVAADGAVYVADGYGNARVVKFSPEGAYLMAWGGRGAAPGQFDVPHGIAVDARGRLYVADRGNARIQVFDGAGRFLRQIAGPEIGRPWAVDLGEDGTLYALDGGDQDAARPRSGLLALTPEGEVLGRWSGYGYEAGNLVWPHDLAVSSGSEVFVGEVLDANRVQKFKPGCGSWAQGPAPGSTTGSTTEP